MRVATRSSLRADLETLGLKSGDSVLVHAALRKVGPVAGGADMIIAALRDAVGPQGTILAYADWQGMDGALADDAVFNDPAIRPDIPAFDPKTSRATRDNGAFSELLRTTPGALRSGSPTRFPSNEEAAAYEFSAKDEAKIADLTGSAIVGGPDTVRRRLEELAESTQADELMITTMVYDHADRIRSYEIVAELYGLEAEAAAAA